MQDYKMEMDYSSSNLPDFVTGGRRNQNFYYGENLSF